MNPIELKRLQRVYQGFVAPIALLVFCIVAVFGVVLPAGQKVFEVTSTRAALQEQVKVLREKANALQGLDEQSLATNLFVASSAIPPDKSIPTLFSTIDGLSSITNIGLVDLSLTSAGVISSGSATKRESFEERQIGTSLLTFTVTLEGDLDQMRNFFETSANVRRLLRVREFSIVFNKSDRATARITMDAFYSPLPTAIAGVSQPLRALTDKEEQTLNRLSGIPYLGAPIVQQRSSGINAVKPDPFSR